MKRLFVSLGCLLALLFLTSCEKVALPASCNGSVRFEYGDTVINITLQEADLTAIRTMFTGKTLFSDNPSCGFTEKASIKLGDQVFCVACDGCGLVYSMREDKFFELSLSEKNELHEILADYGFLLPCA